MEINGYDEWKLSNEWDEYDKEQRRLERIAYDEDHADELYDRLKDESVEKNWGTYSDDEEGF